MNSSKRLFAAFCVLILLPIASAFCSRADAQTLKVQATGTVTCDTDVAGNFFGVGDRDYRGDPAAEAPQELKITA